MNTLLNFKEYLMTGTNPCSPVTAKNYIADIKNFIEWYEQKSGRIFEASNITIEEISDYKKSTKLSPSTIDRHISSLRKFFAYNASSVQGPNPFNQVLDAAKDTDPWALKDFKHFLLRDNSSSLTVKNYTIDISQFFRWLNEVTEIKKAYNINDQNIYKYINQQTIEEYKFRLQTIVKLSPSSINRKLSSLRRYVAWATSEGYIDNNNFTSLTNLDLEKLEGTNNIYNLNQNEPSLTEESITTDINTSPTTEFDEVSKSYSSFPPYRLLQKTRDASLWIFDQLFIYPISNTLDQLEYTKWTLTGKNIFTATKIAANTNTNKIKRSIAEPLAFLTPNFKRSFYAPLSISTRWLPTHKKLLHHIRYTRPKWYNIYHSYAFVHYVHLGLLILAVSLSGYIAYDNYTSAEKSRQAVLSSADHTRLLSYKGQLKNTSGQPITTPTTVKFALYNNPKEKGTALIWQEIHNIKPDINGKFNISLGQLSPMSKELFTQNEKLFLGIKIGSNPELMPRQQIPNTGYTASTETVQGLRPITDPASGETNTLLALDSSGNLTIGGNANPIFQSTGGILTLSGSALLLTTTPGTNTDVVISPDGLGKVDIQNSIHNSVENTEKGILSGAVTIEDNLAVISSTSSQSALFINQNGTGPLISANTGGTAKFIIEYRGNVGIGTTSPAESLLQIADGNDGFGATITAKDGGALLMSSNGTPTLTIGNNTDGKNEINLKIFPSGEIAYEDNADTDAKITLPASKSLYVSGGKGMTIVGEIIPGNDGLYDLGSESLKWNRIYVNEIITNANNGTFGFMQLKDSVVSPSNPNYDLAVGGNSTSSAKFHVLGTGTNAGSVTTTGNIYFNGASPKLSINSNTRFDIETLGPLDSNPTSKFTLLSSGALGLGTTAPLFKLDLVDEQNSTSSALITNTSSSANASVLALKLGSAGSPIPQSSNNYITFLNGDGKSVGAITGNASGGASYLSWGSDFAEYFKKTNPYEVLLPGDIVCLGASGSVSKCTGVSKRLIGVVSDQAGFIGNSRYQNDPKYILIGLIGQLPVTISNENGEIEPGDPIGIGKDGLGVKSTVPGQIIGHAIEGTQNNTENKINVYISLSWHDPKAEIASNGLLNTPLYNSIDSDLEPKLELSLLLLSGKSIISESIEATLLNATDITTNSITIAGKSLNDYVLERIAASLEKINSTEINSPLASINKLRTNIITPLAYDSEIALNFRKNVLEIENTNSKKIVAAIDKDGNAKFEGNLTTQNASIAGTLRADKIIANDLELSPLALEKIRATTTSSQSATYITNVYTATASGQQLEQNLATDTSIRPTNSLGYLTTASLSGNIAYIPDLRAKFATFEQGLMSFGPTSTADLSVVGQLSINGSLILAENSINVLGQDLELQSLRQGNLSIMGGRVKIDTNGNMDVQGDVNFAKNLKIQDTLFAKIISPLSGHNLTIKLNKSNENPNPVFQIEDASGSANFIVNELGEVVASGSGIFKEVLTRNINLIRSAQADTSSIETLASASAGTATINRYQKERTIISPFVKTDSLIYITPMSDPGGATPYIARQTEEIKPGIDPEFPLGRKGSFTIQIPYPAQKDIKINWWIIN